MDHPTQEEPVEDTPPPEPPNPDACALCQQPLEDAAVTHFHCTHRAHTACAFTQILRCDRRDRLWRFSCRICQTPCMTDMMYQHLFVHENNDATTISTANSVDNAVTTLETTLAADPTIRDKIAGLRKKSREYNKAKIEYNKKAKQIYTKFKEQTATLVQILKQSIKEHKKETTDCPEYKVLRSARAAHEAAFSRLVRKYNTNYFTMRKVLRTKYRYRHNRRNWWRMNEYLYKYRIRIS